MLEFIYGIYIKNFNNIINQTTFTICKHRINGEKLIIMINSFEKLLVKNTSLTNLFPKWQRENFSLYLCILLYEFFNTQITSMFKKFSQISEWKKKVIVNLIYSCWFSLNKLYTTTICWILFKFKTFVFNLKNVEINHCICFWILRTKKSIKKANEKIFFLYFQLNLFLCISDKKLVSTMKKQINLQILLLTINRLNFLIMFKWFMIWLNILSISWSFVLDLL